MITALWPDSTKRSEHTSFHTRWSWVILAVSSRAVQGHLRVEPGGAGASVGRGGLAAGDFVGEDELEELGMTHLAGGREGEAFGQRVRAVAELHSTQQCLELGGNGDDGHRAAPACHRSDRAGPRHHLQGHQPQPRRLRLARAGRRVSATPTSTPSSSTRPRCSSSASPATLHCPTATSAPPGCHFACSSK